MWKKLKAGKWSSLTQIRLDKLRSVEFDFEPRAHYNYKKKGTNNEEEVEVDDDDSDGEQDGQDLEESPPHIPARRVPEYQQQRQQQHPQYQNYQRHGAW